MGDAYEAMEANDRRPKPKPDMLRESFALQESLQIEAYGKSPYAIQENEERIQFIKDMHIALTDELHEALGEVGWKPWATSRHINWEAGRGEMVDAFHFFMNLCMAFGLDAELLFAKYQDKRLKNIKRQRDGYDGVEGKCPTCHRALDDDAVTCGPSQVLDGGWFCAGRVDDASIK